MVVKLSEKRGGGKKSMSNLYTAKEAREKLGGIAAETLKRYVDRGKIRKEIPPGNDKKGFYNKEDVDKLAEAMNIFIEVHALAPKNERFEVVQANSQADIKETVQIARQNLGDNAYGLEKRMEWFRKSPLGDYILKHNGIIVGYFSMQAIKQTTVDQIFNHRNGRSIDTDDMETISLGMPLEVHISGMGIKKGISRNDARTYGMELIMGLYKKFIELGKQGLEISKIWAKSSTVPGIKLCQDLGFTELGYINNEQIGFILDLTDSKNAKSIVTRSFIESYQEALNEWRTEQS